MKKTIVITGVTVLSMFGLVGSASAQQDCGEATVCAGVSPQVGPVVGPNEFDLGSLFG